MTTVIESTGSQLGGPSLTPARRGFGREPTIGAWIGVSAAVVVVIVVWHLHGRAPLSWDEAARVDSGSQLVFALRSGSLSGLWEWFNAQTYYPFLIPALHGLVLAATGSVLAAASVPTLAAYVLTGVLAARLAGTLGAGRIGVAVAALVAWLSPINVRLAAGAFTEDLGACVLLGLVLALVQLERSARRSDALWVGLVVLLAWLIKYDYGMLATGITGVAGALAVPRLGVKGAVRVYGVAIAWAVVPVMLMLFGFSQWAPYGLDPIRTFVAQPGIEREIDFLYYPRLLLLNREVGLAPVVAVLLVSGVAACVVECRRRPELRTPVMVVAVWLAVYALAAAKEPRFAALIIPLLGVLLASVRIAPTDVKQAGRIALWTLGGALLISPQREVASSLLAVAVPVAAIALVDTHVLRRLATHSKGVTLWAVVAVLAAPLAWQLGAQVATLRDPLWLVRPDPAIAQALEFTTERLPKSGDSPVLLIGLSNALSPRLLELSWSQRFGRPSPAVVYVPEVRPEERQGALLAAIRTHNPSVVVVVEAGTGGRLGVDRNNRGIEMFPSQRVYAQMVGDLAQRGEFSSLTGLVLDHEPVRITMWQVEPPALQGALRVVTDPPLGGMISVDGVPRNGFGLGTDLPIGEHELCFGAVVGYEPPPCRVVNIEAGGTTSIVGAYTQRAGAPGPPGPAGLLSVNTTPPLPTQISVDGIVRDSQALNALRLDPGDHRVCFRYVPGFKTPPCADTTVTDGAPATVTASFVKDDFQPVRG